MSQPLDNFHISTIIELMAAKGATSEQVARYADMFTALGSEARLRVVRLLLAAHPDGLNVGDIQAELDISASNLSHHLEKLKNEGLIRFTREGTFLRYTARTDALEELLKFLYAECCTRNKAIEPCKIVPLQAAGGFK
jgi:DNA-binding transcriptional ArsR family regulator